MLFAIICPALFVGGGVWAWQTLERWLREAESEARELAEIRLAPAEPRRVRAFAGDAELEARSTPTGPTPFALLEVTVVTPRGVELDLAGTAWGISDVADVIRTIEAL